MGLLPLDVNSPGSSGIPAFAADKVAAALPLDAVRASGQVGVSHGRAAVGPPRVEVPVVGALGVGGRLALGDEIQGAGEHAGDGRAGQQEGRQGNHGGAEGEAKS